LDGMVKIVKHGAFMFHYYIKLVPTVFEGDGRVVYTHQYAVTDKDKNALTRRGELAGLPGVFQALYRGLNSPDLLQGWSTGAATTALSLLEKFEEAPRREKGADSVMIKFHVHALDGNNGHNLSVSGDPGCRKTDNKGSFECMLPFGSEVKLAAKADMWVDITKGSRMRVTLQPKASGVMGMIAKQAMRSLGLSSLELPACGQEASIFVAGKSYAIPPADCGHYELHFDVPQKALTLPALSSLKIPQMAGMPQLPFSDLSKLPPTRMQVRVQLMGQNGKTIFDIEQEFGTGR